jgi:hypothetical protein
MASLVIGTEVELQQADRTRNFLGAGDELLKAYLFSDRVRVIDAPQHSVLKNQSTVSAPRVLTRVSMLWGFSAQSNRL